MLRDGVTYNDIQALHVPEYPLTKYLTLAVWKRHMHYMLNLSGALPAQASGKHLASSARLMIAESANSGQGCARGQLCRC